MRRALIRSCVLILLTAGCDGEPREVDPRQYLSGTVQIGVNVDLPGWSEYRNGGWYGFDIALGDWLGKELNFRPQYVNLTTNERMIRLRELSDDRTDNDTGIKLVIANFSITDPRREEIDFAGPYFLDSQGLMTRTDSGINTPQDVGQKTICAPRGSTTLERSLRHLKFITAEENTLARCVERLLAREVDGVSSDRVVLEGFARRQPTALRIAPNIRVGTEPYGIGLPNNRPELCRLLTEKLAHFLREAWNQRFTESLPGVPSTDRKPNADALDPCEKPG